MVHHLLLAALLSLDYTTPPVLNLDVKDRRTASVQTVSGSGYTFRLSFETVPPRSPSAGDGWGYVKYQPCTHLYKLEAEYLGKRLNLKQSCFSDLYSVVTVELGAVKGGCYLLVKGGDAGGAYTAKISFDQVGLTSRIVRDGEFPDQHYERTEYHWIRNTS